MWDGAQRTARAKRRWLTVAGWVALVVLLVGAGAYLIADHIFNVGSNVVYLANRGSEEPLLVLGDGSEWIPVHDISGRQLEGALTTVYAGDGVRFQRLRVKRNVVAGPRKWVSAVFGSEVNVFAFDPARYAFRTSFLGNFEPTTAAERVESDGLNFALNANFFGPDGLPLGWVVSGGKQLSSQYRRWTGFFFVKGGRPYFGPRSLLDEVEGELTEAAQGYPSLMRDHTIFSYVDLAPDRFFDGKKITYRSLAGVRQDGTVVFVLSGDGGVLNVAEIAQIAFKLRIQHATLWDGGRALQYRFRDGAFEFGFHAFNNSVEFSRKDINRVRSPVFIGVEPKGR